MDNSITSPNGSVSRTNSAVAGGVPIGTHTASETQYRTNAKMGNDTWKNAGIELARSGKAAGSGTLYYNATAAKKVSKFSSNLAEKAQAKGKPKVAKALTSVAGAFNKVYRYSERKAAEIRPASPVRR